MCFFWQLGFVGAEEASDTEKGLGGSAAELRWHMCLREG